MKQITETSAWKSLEQHAQTLQFYTPQDYLLTTPHRKTDFVHSACGITLNFSHQRIVPETITHLYQLAKACAIENKIDAMLRGDIVNPSENRPALHTALRAAPSAQIFVQGQDVVADIHEALADINAISTRIRNQTWRGRNGKAITDIVNVGIGGSDLGPRFTLNALSHLHSPALQYHFISDACPIGLNKALAQLKPETTLFIISSKSFTTPETLLNFEKIKAWAGGQIAMREHFIAVTANKSRALEHGFIHIIPIWSWVGGRFSLGSAINLITAIAIGFDNFNQMLHGARAMDEHLRDSPLERNLPVILALLGIWNINFNHINNLLQLTYGQPLDLWTAYVQQLEMESNGKSIDIQGRAVNYATSPMIWGGPGNQAQHSYYQLLSQGTHPVALDLVSIQSLDRELINRFSQAKLNILSDGVLAPKHPEGFIPGNVPINQIHLHDISPSSIGALTALFEHKVYIQSVIWHINPFDQPGVESAKIHSQGLISELNI